MSAIRFKPDSQRVSVQRARLSEMPASVAVQLNQRSPTRLGARVLGALAAGMVVFARQVRHPPAKPADEDIMRASAGHP
ncbi:MAG: hypothetical protein KGH63_03115 [Candidatus Micrarchaeota archaeon]|nr:hypothetical protein [Candidatus Micrarchaeota archaeon]